jgi:hypothetical protein
MTDPAKIFRMGIEGGKPKLGEVGVVPNGSSRVRVPAWWRRKR